MAAPAAAKEAFPLLSRAAGKPRAAVFPPRFGAAVAPLRIVKTECMNLGGGMGCNINDLLLLFGLVLTHVFVPLGANRKQGIKVFFLENTHSISEVLISKI